MNRIFSTVILGLILLSIHAIVLANADHSADQDFSNEVTVTEVNCTLENGDESSCYQIESSAIPTFEIGPFCPETLEDVGGIWHWDGERSGLYSLNRAFFEMVAEQGYVFYDADNNINIVTEVGTRPQGNAINQNNCLAQTPDETVIVTSLIPTNPILADIPTELGTVSQVGVGIDGVPIFGDAPSATQTGNLPALDICGGHVDPGGWYHWHATSSDIDASFDHEGLEDVHCHLDQSSSALFGYAFDGFPIYGSTEPDGSLPEDLDECSGHVGPTPQDDIVAYHYHATLDFPNLPVCLVGVVASDKFTTTASSGIGSSNENGAGSGPAGDRPAGQPGQRPDFASAAEQLGITEEALIEALGDERPPNLENAAESLDITVEELQQALGTP